VELSFIPDPPFTKSLLENLLYFVLPSAVFVSVLFLSVATLLYSSFLGFIVMSAEESESSSYSRRIDPAFLSSLFLRCTLMRME